jgi:thiol-disulfide isomerase/thioredoxin
VSRRAAVVLAAAVAFLPSCNSSGSPAVGDLAPEFVLQSLDGKTKKLSNYRGKVVLVNLWATWCPPCIEELPVLDTLVKEYGDKGLVVLGVAGDEDTDLVRQFVAKNPAQFEVLLDPDGVIGTRYGITGYPETFFVDRQGKLQHKIIGPLPHDGSRPKPELTKTIDGLLGH